MTVRPRPNALVWLLLSLAVIALDQWSKAWVLSSLPEYTAVPVIEGFWNWYRTYNTGAAFSFLAGAGGWQLWLFTGLAVAISGLLGWWLFNLPRSQWKAALPYALVIGGADGVSPEVLAKADVKLSLSALTLPHPLVRVVLMEQLYRAMSINNNHPYHRGN